MEEKEKITVQRDKKGKRKMVNDIQKNEIYDSE